MGRMYRYLAMLMKTMKQLLWTVLLYVGALTQHTGEEASSGPNWCPSSSWTDDEYYYRSSKDRASKPPAYLTTRPYNRSRSIRWDHEAYEKARAAKHEDARASPASCELLQDPLSELQSNHVEPLMIRDPSKSTAASPPSASTPTQKGVLRPKGPSGSSSARKAGKHVTWAPSIGPDHTQAKERKDSSEWSLPSRLSSSPTSSATKAPKASVPSSARLASAHSPAAPVKADVSSRTVASSPQPETPKSSTQWTSATAPVMPARERGVTKSPAVKSVPKKVAKSAATSSCIASGKDSWR